MNLLVKTNEPCLPRQRKAPKRYDEGSQSHYLDCPKSRYRHSYYEILDLAAGEIERRFTHDDLKIVTQIEELLVKDMVQNVGDNEITRVTSV